MGSAEERLATVYARFLNAGGILDAILLFQNQQALPAYVLRLFHRWNRGEIQDMSNTAEQPERLDPALLQLKIFGIRCSGERRND